MDKNVTCTVPDYKIFEDKYCQWTEETKSAIVDILKDTKNSFIFKVTVLLLIKNNILVLIKCAY